MLHDDNASHETTQTQDEPSTQINTPAPTPAVETVLVVEPTHNVATTLVLQWLTYAFWGWTVLAIGFLVWLVTLYTLQRSFASIEPTTIPYGVAAALILFTISVVCDIFFGRREIEHKSGISMGIMVIHAVIFGLLAVGAIIVMAFNIIHLVVSSGNTDYDQAMIVTAFVMFLVYLSILFRIVKPFIFAKLRLTFRIIMAVVTIGISVIAIVGPVIAVANTKDDRAVANSISAINAGIQSYETTNAKLPASIDVLLDSGMVSDYGVDVPTVKDLVTRKLITYT